MHTATATSSKEVEGRIVELMNALKKSIRQCLENQGVPVDEVADSLTSLLPDDERTSQDIHREPCQ